MFDFAMLVETRHEHENQKTRTMVERLGPVSLTSCYRSFALAGTQQCADSKSEVRLAKKVGFWTLMGNFQCQVGWWFSRCHSDGSSQCGWLCFEHPVHRLPGTRVQNLESEVASILNKTTMEIPLVGTQKPTAQRICGFGSFLQASMACMVDAIVVPASAKDKVLTPLRQVWTQVMYPDCRIFDHSQVGTFLHRWSKTQVWFPFGALLFFH